MRRISVLLVVLLVFAGTLALASCGGKSAEESTFGPKLEDPQSYQVATVNQIFADPDLYDRNVVIDAYIDDVCPAGCWFFIKDKPEEQIRLYVTRNKDAFTVPAWIKGHKAKVYGKVKADNTQEILEGHRVELQD